MEKIKAGIADGITLCRIPFSLLLLVFKADTTAFAVFYLLCGITDILDGFAARRLHTESERGAKLDSIADFVFALVYAVRILPLLHIPFWIWIWTAVIAVIKVFGIVIAVKKEKKTAIKHSTANKLTGILLFLMPLSVFAVDVKYPAAVVCITATLTAVGELPIKKRKEKKL